MECLSRTSGLNREWVEMKTTWVEITCDNCGCADHFPPGSVNKDARKNGWIITRTGKHYDSKECFLMDKPNTGHPKERMRYAKSIDMFVPETFF